MSSDELSFPIDRERLMSTLFDSIVARLGHEECYYICQWNKPL